MTPTSYLTLLKQFNKLLEKQSEMVNKNIKRYEKGISKLAKTDKAVE